jgi:hypothetical protein
MRNKSSSHRRMIRPGVLLVIVCLGYMAPISKACPMCKDSRVDTESAAAASAATLDFNKSIYIMLGGFAGVLGFTGRVMYKATRR